MKTEQEVNQDILDFVKSGSEITLGNITQFLTDSILEGSIERVHLYVMRTEELQEHYRIVDSTNTGIETSELVAIFRPSRGQTDFCSILLGLNIHIEGDVSETERLQRSFEKINGQYQRLKKAYLLSKHAQN